MGSKKSKTVSNYDSQSDFEGTPDLEQKNSENDPNILDHAMSEKEGSNSSKPQSKHSNHSNVSDSNASGVQSKERSLLAFSEKSSQSMGKENETNQQSFLDFSSPAFKKMYSIRADKNVQELYRESIEQKSYVRQQIIRPGEEELGNNVTDESGLHLHLHFHITDNERKDLFLHVHHHDDDKEDGDCGSDSDAEGSDDDDYYYNYYENYTRTERTERSKSKISLHDNGDPNLKVHLLDNNTNNTNLVHKNTDLQKTKTIMSLASRQFTSSSLLVIDDSKEGLPKLILPNDVNPDRDFKRVPTKIAMRRRSSVLSRKNSHQSIDNDQALPKLILANDVHPDRDFKRIPTKHNLKRKKSLINQNSVSNDMEQTIPHLVIADEINLDRDFKNPNESIKFNNWGKIPTIDEGCTETKVGDDINCVEPFEENGNSSTTENVVSTKITNSIDTKLSRLREEDSSKNIEGSSKTIHIDKNYNENLHLHVHVHREGE